MLRKKRSTMFGDETEVGVKWKGHAYLADHAFTFGCLCVARWPQVSCKDFSFGVSRSTRRKNSRRSPCGCYGLQCTIAFPTQRFHGKVTCSRLKKEKCQSEPE